LAGTPKTHEPVSNTSPLLFLHRIDRLDLLPLLFGGVIVTPAVLAEIEAGNAKATAVPDLLALPWIRVQSPDATLVAEIPSSLGMGEREVLALAIQTGNRVVILDDKAGRRFASSRGILLTGTLGVLVRGRQEGILEAVLPLLDRLTAEGFRLSARARAAALSLCGEL
jgi:uncharacterized protein